MDKTTSEMHPLIERFGDSGVRFRCFIAAVGLTFGVVAQPDTRSTGCFIP